MSTFETPLPETNLEAVKKIPVKISLRRILAESARLYARYFVPFTRVLIAPTLQILVGAYGCLWLSFWFISLISDRYGDALAMHLPEAIGGLLVIIVVTMLIFKKGFLEYLLYVASLCASARDAIEGRAPDCRADYQAFFKHKLMPYAGLVSAYFLLFLLPGLPLTLTVAIAGVLHPEPVVGPILLGIGMLATLVLFVLWLISLFFLTFIFQIAGLDEKLPLNPLPMMLKSARVFLKAPFRTTALQILLLIATGTLIPWPIAMLARLLSLCMPLDHMHAWLAGNHMKSLAPGSGWEELPMYSVFYPELLAHIGEIAASFTDTLVMAVVTSLLLPLGTFCFTLLYLKLAPESNTVHRSVPSDSPLLQPSDTQKSESA